MKNKNTYNGFTLAEVLITLGVIGVVAAMTLPVLIQNYKKSIVETRLVKFYSAFNQAINLSQAENGSYMDWNYPKNNSNKYEVETWFNKYIRPYIKYLKTETIEFNKSNDYRTLIYLTDGSAVIFTIGVPIFFTDAKYLKHMSVKGNVYSTRRELGGIEYFYFLFEPTYNNVIFYNKGLRPYRWNGTSEKETEERFLTQQYTGCNENANDRMICARWIEMNGWKIPKKYPFKF